MTFAGFSFLPVLDLAVNCAFAFHHRSRFPLLEAILHPHQSRVNGASVNANVLFQPGQYILLQCENISTLEWHPFTITDYVVEAKQTMFTLAVFVRGDWTGELYQKVFNLKLYSERSKRRRSRNRRRRVPIPRKLIFILDGPFHSPMESVLANSRVVLIGAGIGVTPFISVFNYIM
jgi:NADPH oxidase 5